ncbi:MAG: pyridine nucleotide-disulfide oxidoreductase, partial [Acidobacteriota bacterium]
MSVIPSALTPLGLPGFTFADLHEPARLADLHQRFVADLQAAEPGLWERWSTPREGAVVGAVDHSNLLVAMAPHVSRFVARLFAVGPDAEALVAATRAYDDLFRFKIDFVRRRALPLLKGGAPVQASAADHAYVAAIVAGTAEPGAQELAIARAGCALLDREEAAKLADHEAAKAGVAAEIDALRRWCAAHVHAPAFKDWVVFRFPETLDYQHLVHITRPNPVLPNALTGPDARLRRRDGFTLTDPRFSTREVLSEVHYCVLCHERDKDSCSKGITDKQGAIVANPLGIALGGCPLEEKISEMHLLRKRGDAIGALALVMIDNPMCPGTGHRICNDCMKACIFQKQEPVNIPQAETGVLTDVLNL